MSKNSNCGLDEIAVQENGLISWTDD